ncbi:MAG: Crp/Fnr family transcriptional regulator [Bacteroidota bacterium]
MKNTLDLLQPAPIFLNSIRRHIALSDQEASTLANLIEEVHLAAGQQILSPNEVCHHEYFIVSGIIRTYYIDELGTEHTTLFSTDGWWTGNLKSFVTETLSEYFLEAGVPTTVYRLNREAVANMYQRVPAMNEYFRILLTNRLIKTQDRVSYHLSSTATERYETFRRQYPNLEQLVPQKQIASYLGITPAYLSRMRKRLARN